MKKINCLVWTLFAATSVGLRVWQTRVGYEESGLAKHDFFPGILLPILLLAAAVFFAFSSRSLPGRRADVLRLTTDFRFADKKMATVCVAFGALLVLLGGGLNAIDKADTAAKLFAIFALAGAVCTIHVARSLYRETAVKSLALLVPICAFASFLVFVYRVDAADPVLARTYIEIIAIAALTLSTAQRAAFVFGGSSLRRHLPVSAFAAMLSLTAAAEGGSLSRVMFFIGCAAVELGFLAGAQW